MSRERQNMSKKKPKYVENYNFVWGGGGKSDPKETLLGIFFRVLFFFFLFSFLKYGSASGGFAHVRFICSLDAEG